MKWDVIRVMMGLFVAVLFGMAGCGGGSSNNVPNNKTTAANAGPAQNVVAGSLVTLNGSQSTGADGSLITYQWSMTTKPVESAATIINPTTVNPTFTPDLSGQYSLKLVITDTKSVTSESTVIITASVDNAAPVANAGTAQSVVAGAVVTLDGSASSDANGDLLTYSWAFTSKPAGSSLALSIATAAKPTFTADVAGAYVLNLVVNDGKLFSTPAQVTVTATDPPGTIVKKIPFPSGVSWVGDMVYDVSGKTVWLLAGSQTVLDKFMQIDATGAVLKTVPNLTFWINHGSELAIDGANLWATSYGWSNGVPQSYIYKIDPLTGLVATSFPCPASSTGGFCEGIAWDGSKLWSAASDNKNLVSYSTDGTLQSSFINEFSTIGTNTHLSYHASPKRIIAFHDGINLIDLSTGATTASNVSIYPHSSGWDGQSIWRANNSTQEIEVVYLGL